MAKLTKAQARALSKMAEANSQGRQASKQSIGASVVVLGKLESLGLIHSAKPFAYAYHTMTITPAGRAALKQGGE